MFKLCLLTGELHELGRKSFTIPAKFQDFSVMLLNVFERLSRSYFEKKKKT